ncbi:protein kinase domain-containing protein [Mycetocola sp.]|uniref:protein kinase domain-containing protein n=1 Tax=Mycetocola sp. TaxID=1871042 RepID=UPI003989F8B0
MSEIPAGLIGGRYRLGELLGSGGSASVFAATDSRSGAEVAIKILHPHLGDSPLAREAILAEALAASELRHPNIVSSLDAGIHDIGEGSLAWIAMDRAPGVTLLEFVQAGGPLSIADAATVAEAVLRALAAAHGIRLIHRDVSPSNVMVDLVESALRVADVRLLDFGLAAPAGNAALGVAGDGEERLAILGNANYTSPEQAAAEPVDERGDLYQVGGVLYFALTGRPPFPRASVEATLAAHRNAPPPVPSVLRRDTPRQLDRIVVKALLKHPADRFQAAEEMLAEVTRLRQTLAGPADATPPDFATSRTRVLAAGDRTELLTRPAPGRPAAVATQRTGPKPVRRKGTRGRGNRTGGWLGGIIVAALIGSAWFLAASSPGPVVAEPSPSATPTATPPATSEASAPPPRTPAASPTRQVPSIEMTSLADARTALTAAGLTIRDLVIQNSEHPGDTVLLVSPPAGSPLPVGGSVDLVVASGSNAVPDVRGRTEADAVAALHAAGFAVVLRNVVDGSVGPGTVVTSEPAPASVGRLNTDVVLFISVAPTPSPTPSQPPAATPTPIPTPPATVPPEVE